MFLVIAGTESGVWAMASSDPAGQQIGHNPYPTLRLGSKVCDTTALAFTNVTATHTHGGKAVQVGADLLTRRV